MGRPSRYSPEVRERSVRLVLDQADKHSSQWAAIQSVASKIGCTAETLRKWVRQAEYDAGVRDGLTTTERERLKFTVVALIGADLDSLAAVASQRRHVLE